MAGPSVVIPEKIITIEVGTGLVTADDFRRVLNGICDIGEKADDVLDAEDFIKSISPVRRKVNLGIFRVSHITCKNGGTFAEILAGIKHFGLKMCSAEMGPQFCLQAGDQLEDDDSLTVVMEPIAGSGRKANLFELYQDPASGLWLSVDYGRNESIYYPTDEVLVELSS